LLTVPRITSFVFLLLMTIQLSVDQVRRLSKYCGIRLWADSFLGILAFNVFFCFTCLLFVILFFWFRVVKCAGISSFLLNEFKYIHTAAYRVWVSIIRSHTTLCTISAQCTHDAVNTAQSQCGYHTHAVSTSLESVKTSAAPGCRLHALK